MSAQHCWAESCLSSIGGRSAWRYSTEDARADSEGFQGGKIQMSCSYGCGRSRSRHPRSSGSPRLTSRSLSSSTESLRPLIPGMRTSRRTFTAAVEPEEQDERECASLSPLALPRKRSSRRSRRQWAIRSLGSELHSPPIC